jgi:hypothetical protein
MNMQEELNDLADEIHELVLFATRLEKRIRILEAGMKPKEPVIKSFVSMADYVKAQKAYEKLYKHSDGTYSKWPEDC